MAKTYFNDAIVGNSRMLGCLTGNGELVRLFWPNIDYRQHIDRFLAGIFFEGIQYSTMWLHEDYWSHEQYYSGDTNILKTLCVNRDAGLSAEQTDYVLPEADILARSYEITNSGGTDADLGFMVFAACISTNADLCNVLYDFDNDAVIFYSHDCYIAITADRESEQFQLGNNAFESARSTRLNGFDNIGMMADGAVSWRLGTLKPGSRSIITLYICASDTLKGAKRLVRSVKETDERMHYKATENYWKSFLKGARQLCTGNDAVDGLYKRSLLVFKLMSDEKTGGLLAAPEIDEEFTRCGRYAYCWGRDAAFITGALDRCGLSAVVDRFYEWAVSVQDDNGAWHQRYHMDGNLAPSWGLQIDETGTLIWGMLKHYEATGCKAFLQKMWDSVHRAVGFLLSFMDEDTGLPAPSFDLWEERYGEHAYSSAAVYGGIMAGAEIAVILGMGDGIAAGWRDAAHTLKDNIARNFWKGEKGSFIRSIRVKMNPWGSENTPHTVLVKVNPKGYVRDVTLEDHTMDVSLLGLCIPFGVFAPDDCRISSTAGLIERTLTSPVAGGIRRYETDGYIGGNPWVLATLWTALYHIARKDYGAAREYFDWAVKSRTALGLLPEQVDRNNGSPAWVFPLTWSHAMFVLVLMELADAGVLQA